jgi:hypothetical protein
LEADTVVAIVTSRSHGLALCTSQPMCDAYKEHCNK